MRSNHPNRVLFFKKQTPVWCHCKKKSAKNRAGGAKLPPGYFGKPACENQ